MNRLNKQKQIRMTDGEAKWLSEQSFKRDRSESWIIREALEKVYPEIFGKRIGAGAEDGDGIKREREESS